MEKGDHTSLNGIELMCGTATRSRTGRIVASKVGPWGSSPRGFTECKKHEFLTSFNLKVERPLVSKNSCRVYSYIGSTYEENTDMAASFH